MGRIYVYGDNGDDTITVSNQVTIATVIYGAMGNDQLTGGAGANFVDGGEGDETMMTMPEVVSSSMIWSWDV